MADLVLPISADNQVYVPYPDQMGKTTMLMRMVHDKRRMSRTPGKVISVLVTKYPANQVSRFFENVGHDLNIALLGWDTLYEGALEMDQPPLEALETMGKIMENIKNLHLWAYRVTRHTVGGHLDEFMAGLDGDALRFAMMSEFKSWSDGFVVSGIIRFNKLVEEENDPSDSEESGHGQTLAAFNDGYQQAYIELKGGNGKGKGKGKGRGIGGSSSSSGNSNIVGIIR